MVSILVCGRGVLLCGFDALPHVMCLKYQITNDVSDSSDPSQIVQIAIRMVKMGFDRDPVAWNQWNPQNPRSN